MGTESILTSIKKMLGIENDYDHFDPELIVHINSVFATLCDLGVGPKEPYTIEDASNAWNEFATGSHYQNIKSYIYLRVRLLFDPPSNSFLVNSIAEQIKELEWRLNVQAETIGNFNDGEPPSTTSADIFIKPEDGKLPEVGEPNKIYRIPNGGDDPENKYDEYYWNPDLKKFELIGPAMEEMTSEEFKEMWNKHFKGE